MALEQPSFFFPSSLYMYRYMYSCLRHTPLLRSHRAEELHKRLRQLDDDIHVHIYAENKCCCRDYFHYDYYYCYYYYYCVWPCTCGGCRSRTTSAHVLKIYVPRRSAHAYYYSYYYYYYHYYYYYYYYYYYCYHYYYYYYCYY